jgi:hypothetical protein
MALMVIHMARHSVCFVARGFTQVEGSYFNETNKLCPTKLNDLFKPKQVHWRYIEAIWNG